MNLHQDSPQHTPLQAGGSWAERNGFSHWALAMIWIVVAFILFQATAAIVSVALIIISGGLEPDADFLGMLNERLDLLFIGNSTGQILFLGLASYLVAGLHVSKPERKSFLRFRSYSNTGVMVGITAVLFVAVQPAVWYIGYLNSLLPVPEVMQQMQKSQYELIEGFLTSDGVLLMALINIALVPAICEEVMFRGYVQSAFEKSWGVWPAILVSGLIFGLFHIQLANLLPLATLGILLALVTWLSGSLLPAIAAHFINNGSAVLLATYYPELAFAEMSPETAPPIWMLILSIVLSAGLIRMLYRQSETQ
jgi:membrane protease YdiL (CAAX protease family)